MKILIVADGSHHHIYDGAFENGFKNLGHDVYRFSWNHYFKSSNRVQNIYYKIQNKFTYGSRVNQVNNDILIKVNEFLPDLVFIYRGTHIFPSTLNFIKENYKSKIFGYNNDDPFSVQYQKYFWRHYKGCLKYYDHVFAYREKNISDYNNLGITRTSILRSYYLKEKNFFIESLNKKTFKNDVVFIGHWENDGRDEVIKFLLDNGVNIRLYGTLWQKSRYFKYFIEKFNTIIPLYGEDYNIALNNAKIALVFLSKLNNDTYTRRCFEIPATKTMMISEYTTDLNNLFVQGKEADYFRTKEELLNKITFYLENMEKLREIGENGYKKLIDDGHEVTDRCSEVLGVFDEIK